jgi:hypothetical protein
VGSCRRFDLPEHGAFQATLGTTALLDQRLSGIYDDEAFWKALNIGPGIAALMHAGCPG